MNRIRDLRLAQRLTQRQVAEAIGIKGPTYANAESSRHRRLRGDRVEALAKLYNLGPLETAELVAGWNAMPESEYNARNATSWAARDERRSKLKMHDRMKLSLLEVTTLLVTTAVDPDTLCSCAEIDMFADASDAADPPVPCELCAALQLLGLTGWTTLDEVVAKLAAIQEGMTG